VILTLYTSYLSDDLDDIEINFSEYPLSDYCGILRGCMAGVLYAFGCFSFIMIVRTFEL
jgi:hypothetical protein